MSKRDYPEMSRNNQHEISKSNQHEISKNNQHEMSKIDQLGNFYTKDRVSYAKKHMHKKLW